MEDGEDPIPDARIVVRGTRIEALGPKETTPIPDGATLIDIAGGYLLTGLLDWPEREFSRRYRSWLLW